jgi:glutamate synthase (NADPH/NADH) large chain
VRLETDGKLMTGRDVAIAAMLGAEEFGFATAPLVTVGCLMMRVCNLDTCPVGVATQNPMLRKRFCGKPEYVMNFMRFVAQELREIMARLGVRTVDELVGRTDLLTARKGLKNKRADSVDMSLILNHGEGANVHFEPSDVYDFKLEETADSRVLFEEFKENLETGQKKAIEMKVSNTDRTFGTLFGAEVTRRFGNTLSDDTFTVKCTGSGGQSFGAFIPKGLTLELEGDSNDYFGKGLSGGKLIVYPPKQSVIKAEENLIIGNVALYGATSGYAFIRGMAGERFCVRNSGATAVVEGVGDHGCEYMTGGCVVVLGRTGKNFAAGMSGGVAYVLDENHDFYMRVNKDLILMSAVIDKQDIDLLSTLISEHVNATGSEVGKTILSNFNVYLPKFKKIIPIEYKRVITVIDSLVQQGMPREQAEVEAFYMGNKEVAFNGKTVRVS